MSLVVRGKTSGRLVVYALCFGLVCAPDVAKSQTVFPSAFGMWAQDYSLVTLFSYFLVAALAVLTALLAFGNHRKDRRLEQMQEAHHQVHARLMERVALADELLHAKNGFVAVWASAQAKVQSFGAAEAPRKRFRLDAETFWPLEQWVEATQAQALYDDLERLKRLGTPFSRKVRAKVGDTFAVEGRAFGSRIVLSVRLEQGPEPGAQGPVRSASLDLLEARMSAMAFLFDHQGTPVWLRDAEGSFVWSNRSFYRLLKAENLSDLQVKAKRLMGANSAASGALGCERDGVMSVNSMRYRWQEHQTPGGYAGWCETGASSVVSLEGLSSVGEKAYANTFDAVSVGLIRFSSDRKVSQFNKTAARLFDLDEAWLASQPEEGPFFEVLRERAGLSIRQPFYSWRDDLFAQIAETGEVKLDLRLKRGKVLSLLGLRADDGDITFLFKDETDEKNLRSRLRTEEKRTRAIIERMRDAIAIFEGSGHLIKCNSAFQQLWGLSKKEIDRRPHIKNLAKVIGTLCHSVSASETILYAVVDSRSAERGRMELMNGTILDFEVGPIFENAFLVTFGDVTASINMERMGRLKGASAAAEEGNRATIESTTTELDQSLSDMLELSRRYVTLLRQRQGAVRRKVATDLEEENERKPIGLDKGKKKS